MIILGIESSCDESAAAVVKDGKEVLSSVIASQIDTHKEFGGVVPEVASRLHVENISWVIDKALKDAGKSMEEIDAIAITQGPGLIGCLQVGMQAAKALAFAYGKPLIPVNHLAGHIYVNSLLTDLSYPLLALLVSGGNSELIYMPKEGQFEILGETQDDAIGEAYDKVARVLDLGYPGGPVIDKLAKEGKAIYKISQPKTKGAYDFSFSGLKSSILQLLARLEKKGESYKKEDVAASFQHVALNEILDPVKKALENYDVKQFIVGGGVSANSQLRKRVQDLAREHPEIEFILPPLAYTTDNAAMIAVAGEIAAKENRLARADTPSLSSMELM